MSAGCALCSAIAVLGKKYPEGGEAYNRAVDELFDQCVRVQRLHRNYKARRRMHGRFR
ncbi:MAG: hypothetical protein ABWX96_13605 [Propionibacteriaceae bacterium]